MNSLIEETRKALSVWQRLSFRIDRTLEKLHIRQMELCERMEGLSVVEKRYYTHLLNSVEDEVQRLQEMRHYTPGLQYHALMGERLLTRVLRRVQRAHTPPWWKFWKGSHAHDVAQGEVKAQRLCGRLRNKARRVLALAPEEELVEAVQVQRMVRFLHLPLLYQTIRCLAQSQQKVESLVDSLDPNARGVSAELGGEVGRLLEWAALLEQEFVDLLRQCLHFSQQEKAQALSDLAENADYVSSRAEKMASALRALKDSELDACYQAAMTSLDERLLPSFSAVEREIRDWIEGEGEGSISRWSMLLRSIADGHSEAA